MFFSFAFEQESVFFSDKERFYSYTPSVSEVSRLLFKSEIDYFESSMPESWGEFFQATFYPGFLFSRGRVAFLFQPMIRVKLWESKIQMGSFNGETENQGFDIDAGSIFSSLYEKLDNRVYIPRFFVLLRYPVWFVDWIKFGKLWVNFSPYTIYRTWGIEGLMVRGRPGNLYGCWNFLFSVQPVENKNRTLVAGKLRTQAAGCDFHGVFSIYKIPDVRKDSVFETGLTIPVLDKFKLRGLFVSRTHTEEGTAAFVGDTKQMEFKFILPILGTIFRINRGFRWTSPDFMPVDSDTWLKYPPYQSSGYSWIYEELRSMVNNEKADWWETKFSLAGLNFHVLYENASPFNRELLMQRDWEQLNPPGRWIKVKVYYVTRTFSTISLEWWSKKAEAPYHGEYSLNVVSQETYIPFTTSFYGWFKLMYVEKSGAFGDRRCFGARLLLKYIWNFLTLWFESKISSPDQEEPLWLLTSPYWWEQSWGIDNFVRLRLEVNF